jgi:RNA polymerase sigma-70 factor (ECF subfamily)
VVTEEKELIGRLGRGEKSAFQELVENYKKKVYYLALDMAGNHADAEDISLEVFLKVYRSFKTFKREARLGSWLYRITYNTCIDHLRRKAITPEPVEDKFLELSSGDDPQHSHSGYQDPAMATEKALLRLQIERALQKISAQERAVFVLRHYEDLKLGDIAETLNISIGSVKSYLFRAIKKIQDELRVRPANPGPEVSHD